MIWLSKFKHNPLTPKQILFVLKHYQKYMGNSSFSIHKSQYCNIQYSIQKTWMRRQQIMCIACTVRFPASLRVSRRSTQGDPNGLNNVFLIQTPFQLQSNPDSTKWTTELRLLYTVIIGVLQAVAKPQIVLVLRMDSERCFIRYREIIFYMTSHGFDFKPFSVWAHAFNDILMLQTVKTASLYKSSSKMALSNSVSFLVFLPAMWLDNVCPKYIIMGALLHQCLV